MTNELPSKPLRPATLAHAQTRWRTAVATAACSLLAACASPSDRDITAWTTAEVPTAWSQPVPDKASATSTPRSLALAQWWSVFEDDLLKRLVEQALKHNTSVAIAQANLRQARAQRQAQSAGLGPSVSASLSGQRSKSGDTPSTDRFSTSIDASWEPDVFGVNAQGLAAADADLKAAEAQLGDVQVSLAAEVAIAYVEARALQQRLGIAQRNLSTQTETAQITSWRTDAGLASSLEREQAKAAVAQTDAQVAALQTSLTQARHALSILTGQLPGALDTAFDPSVAIPAPSASLTISFPADTLRQRPDIRTAEYQVLAATARADQAQAARYPSFRLSGSLGLGANTLRGLTDGGASIVNSLLASLTAPLWDGGVLKAQAEVASAGEVSAAAAYRQSVLVALKEVEDALAAIDGNRLRLERLTLSSDAAASAELLARQQYTSGLLDFQSVLETQRTLLSAQDSVATAKASLATSHIQLYKALGGGWQPDPTEPTTPATAPTQ
ncbi:efflux transporter outer membrane subunit [Hydrogenophaga sp. 5NK40-0174]|uniref:efflux transporter outer membrane subunit n=1 Tax=Hydrogenophaga sp. 5NK40-0174 TaxID=3127649 RepID=UPI00310A6E0E